MKKFSHNQEFIILPKLRHSLNSQSDYTVKINIDDQSICLGRELLDKHSNQNTTMLSAVCPTTVNKDLYYIYISEQKNKNNKIIKFSIKLTNKNKSCLRYYDKDTKTGIHIHNCKNNIKIRKHFPFKGYLKEIAKDIIKTIETNFIQ